jgi:hypothetical protein
MLRLVVVYCDMNMLVQAVSCVDDDTCRHRGIILFFDLGRDLDGSFKRFVAAVDQIELAVVGLQGERGAAAW